MSGHSAVVTGASKGIGRGIAIALARDGWDVVVNFSTNEGAAKETAEAVVDAGARALLVGGDVTDPETSTRLAAAASELGPLGAWVNNAGVSVLAPIVETPVQDMERMLAVNYMGTFHGVQAAARTMIAAGTPGRIVNVASEAAVLTFRYLGAYAASKFAVVGLTQAAALELGQHGISVNAVGPGTTETDMVFAERSSEVSITGDEADSVRASYLANIPLGRFCTPEDTGALVAWLVSPAAGYVTGQIICNNGGSVLH
ncbi:MAG: diacetyl reductase [Actinomycetia bacterium]|nr:diacetyl reductase [Actinomycetes bacterium]MDQ1462776.1 meso-butanediol dehydrogenase / (S,S)-butanediol dehydrogenase / diacetyl reductase [Actinomycetota bacterium]